VTDRRQQPGPGALARNQVGIQPPSGREVAGVHVATSCGEEQLDPGWALSDVQLRCPLIQRGCLAGSDAAHRLLSRQNQVVDRLLPMSEVSGLDVVVRQLGDQTRVVLAHAALENPRDPSVVSRAAGGGHPIEHGLPCQRMREPVATIVGVRDEKAGAYAEVDSVEDHL
jgi:hypothetical protein